MSVRFQLPLSVQLRDDATFSNYLPGPNQALLNLLSQKKAVQPYDQISSFIYLYGLNSSGRTHLLQAACHEADQLSHHSIYLPMRDIIDYSPEMLEDIEFLDLICIDDIQVLAGNNIWEEAIFHLFNRVQESGQRLVISANHAPSKLQWVLPDLASRLTCGITMPLSVLNDEEKQQALCLRARFRGFELHDTVVRYIFYRSKKDMHQLFDILETLDQASLRAKRKISIPFIREVMHW
ncbi:MAG: DnaA regulatory inactivator Hda [Endozoicomonadaceae bacterium]|nr:DnaA regulatory inactivator Hda [Endozoicomonadaceae bacterium]